MIKRLWNNQYIPKEILLEREDRPIRMRLRVRQRNGEWTARWDPDDPEHVGVGNTDMEAIEDLKRLDEERAEAEEGDPP